MTHRGLRAFGTLGDRRLNRKIIRPGVARPIAGTLCTPVELTSIAKFADDIVRFDEEIASDTRLALPSRPVRTLLTV